MKPKYRSLKHLIEMMEEPNRYTCLRILEENRGLFGTVRGSSRNHQAWPGGYADHVRETMNIGLVLYDQFDAIRPLPFKRSDVLLILFLHDLEKPWKYEVARGKLRIKPSLRKKSAQREFRTQKLEEYGIKLTPYLEAALEYVEGEREDHSTDKRVMNELAALCNMADVASARLWHDYPKAKHDPWFGAYRSNQAT